MTNKIRIAIAGLGTVGVGVIRLLQNNHDLLLARCGVEFELVAVSARDKSKDRGIKLSDNVTWYDNAIDLANDEDIDVVLELIGGSDGVAKELVEKALKAKKHVTTANKALIAHHGAELVELAKANDVAIFFEAAVAGGIPAVKTLREGLAANKIEKIAGILNGTCNYILTNMESSGRNFEAVLQDAQNKGYAEADPAFDVGGVDAAHKLAILASIAYGVAPTMDGLYIEGIENINYEDIKFAAELGYSIRLLGIASESNSKIERRVHPCLVKAESPLGMVDDVFNAVQFNTSQAGDIFIHGRGAGAAPTASSVVADLMDIARGIFPPMLDFTDSGLKSLEFSSIDDVKTCYYLRLSVEDKSGVMAEISSLFSKYDVSMESVIQPEHDENENANIILTTHTVKETIMKKLILEIENLQTITAPPKMIRIEKS